MSKQNNWMELFFESMNNEGKNIEIKLYHLALPGTHHSLVNKLQGWADLFSSLSVCQSASIS
jgi:hypothetical protein